MGYFGSLHHKLCNSNKIETLKHFWISCSSLSTLLFLFSSCHIPSFSSFFPFSHFLVPSSFLVPFYSSLASSSASTVPSSSSPVPPSFPIPPLFPFSHSFSSFLVTISFLQSGLVSCPSSDKVSFT